MLSLVGVGDFGYRLVDIKSFKVFEKSKAELLEYINSGNEVDNIELNSKHTHIIGTRGNLSRYKDGVKSNSLVVLYMSKLTHGVIYYVSNSLGMVAKMSEDELMREGRKHSLANGSFTYVGSGINERVIVKSLGKTFREVVEKSYKQLDLEDYTKMYKRYAKISNGCDSSSAVGNVINTFTGGFVHEKKIGETNFESFITNYKIVRALLNRSRLYKCEKIYSYYLAELEGNSIKYTCEGLVGYLVTIENWKVELFIPSFDKNLVQMFKAGSVSNLKFKDLSKLFTYDREEPNINDSVKASIQICEGFNKDVIKHFNKELATNGRVEVSMNDDFTFNLGSMSNIQLKYSLNIKSRDVRAMRAKLMK